jgi:hypothetical protein
MILRGGLPPENQPSREIDMTSLLPQPQTPNVSTPYPYFEAFMEQRGELLK